MRNVLLAVAVLAASVGEVASETASFKVIVNSKVGGRNIPRDVLSQIYLGQATRWGNGTAIAAVDLSGTSPVRRAFSQQVLGMPTDAVINHWMRRIIAGQRPLLSKATEDEVVAFVASQPGGVGYVSAATSLPAGVTEVSVQ
jgi:ABC-type phosphate transport system substrate-binding protein